MGEGGGGNRGSRSNYRATKNSYWRGKGPIDEDREEKKPEENREEGLRAGNARAIDCERQEAKAQVARRARLASWLDGLLLTMKDGEEGGSVRREMAKEMEANSEGWAGSMAAVGPTAGRRWRENVTFRYARPSSRRLTSHRQPPELVHPATLRYAYCQPMLCHENPPPSFSFPVSLHHPSSSRPGLLWQSCLHHHALSRHAPSSYPFVVQSSFARLTPALTAFVARC
ncbi:hypothetical protein NL676_028554 [Syzygium grande]|nr:hypothetical protein NL676_028554 [Syzygium grande]